MIEAGGRNGWFKFVSVGITVGMQEVFVNFYSNKIGKMPPIMFTGLPEELLAMFKDIVQRLEEDISVHKLGQNQPIIQTGPFCPRCY